jgi:predicted HTH domain antitoxin
MQVTLDIPEVLAGSARGALELSRKVREALAVEGYLAGALTRGQIGASLGMSFFETEAWFVRKGVPRNYDTSDLEADRATLDRLLAAP